MIIIASILRLKQKKKNLLVKNNAKSCNLKLRLANELKKSNKNLKNDFVAWLKKWKEDKRN